MTIDEDSIKQLRDRGALVGTSSADEWDRLLKKHGMGQLCWAIGVTRAKIGRQPSWQQVEEKLPTTPSREARSNERSGPTAGENPAPPTSSPSVAPIRITKPPAAVEVDDQVERLDDTRITDALIEMEGETDLRSKEAPKRRAKPVDWREALRTHGGSTKREIADTMGGTQAAFHTWLYNHRAEVVDCGTPNASNKPRRYWLKGAAGAPQPGSAPAADVSDDGGAAEPESAPEAAVTPAPAHRSPDLRPQQTSATTAAPEAPELRCNGCSKPAAGGPCGWCAQQQIARLTAELAKALLESDELGREVASLQAVPIRPSIPKQLRAELEQLHQQLLEARAAIAAIPKE